MSITIWFMILAVISIAVFDVWVIKKKGKRFAISSYIIRMQREYHALNSIVCMLFGILLGHLFWSMSDFDWMPLDQIQEKCRAVLGGSE